MHAQSPEDIAPRRKERCSYKVLQALSRLTFFLNLLITITETFQRYFTVDIAKHLWQAQSQ